MSTVTKTRTDAPDETMDIERGVLVTVQDASGATLARRALTGVIDGADFPVVWACREEEWTEALDHDREPIGAPWPAEDVQLAEVVSA